jgi:hypothetical protein
MKGFLGSLSDVFGILVAMFATPNGVSSSLLVSQTQRQRKGLFLQMRLSCEGIE